MNFWINFGLIALLAIYWLFGRRIQRGLSAPTRASRTNQPTVSVVVAARNEARRIGALLNDLALQGYPRELLEIIVIDDSSTDTTAEIVTQHSDTGVRLIQLEHTPPGWSPKKFALQKGIEASTGEIILTTDADCRVGPRWIEGMVAGFDDSVGLVAGFSRISKKETSSRAAAAWEGLDFFALLSAAAGTLNKGMPMSVTGQNLAYRREAWEQVGGFEAIHHRPSGDDMLMMQLIAHRTDWQCHFHLLPDSFVSTRACESVRELIHQRLRWASNASSGIFMPWPFLTYLVTAWLLALAQVTLILTLPFNPSWAVTTVALWSVKTWMDYRVLALAARRFDTTDLLRHMPLWVTTVPFYTTAIGAFGPLGRFTWKGRKFSASARIGEPATSS